MRKRFFPLILVFLLIACSVFQSAGQSQQPAGGGSSTSLASTSMPSPSVSFAASPSKMTTPTVTNTPVRTPTATHPSPTLWPTFTPLPPWQAGLAVNLTALTMMDAAAGWGIESRGYILHTTDGGQTWKDVTPKPYIFVRDGFFALDAHEAWAISTLCRGGECPDSISATIWHTVDGGVTWQPGQPICLVDPGCKYYNAYVYIVPSLIPIAMQFVNRKIGWLLVNTFHHMGWDYCRLYQTTDGGKNWDLLHDTFDIPCGDQVKWLAFVDANTGWMGSVGESGPNGPQPGCCWSVSATRDGGHTWLNSQLPPPADLPTGFIESMYWCGDENISTIPPHVVDLTICEDYNKDTYHIHYHSIDGGGSWHSWQAPGSVKFIDAETGWALVPSITGGLSLLQQTSDGGLTWVTINRVAWEAAQFDFISARVGWAIATSVNASTFVHTVDGGLTWVETRPVVAP